MDYNIKSFIDNSKEIGIPEEVDLVIDKAIKRAKNRHKNNFIKITGAVVCIFALVVVLNKTSPVFAEYVSNASTAAKNLLSKFNDKGLDNAIKNGFVQDSSKDKMSNSATCKGITVTVNQFTMSGNQLIIGYTSKLDNSYSQWKDLDQKVMQITDDKGNILYESFYYGVIENMKNKKDRSKVHYNNRDFYSGYFEPKLDNGDFKNSREKQRIVEFSSNDQTKLKTIPESINIKFSYCSDTDIVNIKEYNKHGFFYKAFNKAPTVILGDWTINIKISDKLKNAEEIKYVKAQETPENHAVKIEYVNLYPTSANCKFIAPAALKPSNPYLEDDKGNKYECRGWGRSDFDNGFIELTANFQNPYFEKVEKLYLVFSYIENGKDNKLKIELKKQ